MRRTRVLITNATSDAGLSVVQSLVRSGYHVESADVVHMPFGVKSRFVSAHHVLANSTEYVYAAALLDLVDRIHPDVFLPVGMREISANAGWREAMGAMTALNVSDTQAVEVTNDKSASIASLEDLGVACARVYSYADAASVLSADTDATLVVKPKANIGAARGVSYVKTEGELDNAIARCGESYGGALIQEFVRGGSEAMKTVVLLYSPESRLVAAFTTSKIREWPTTGGLTVVSRSTRDQAIVEQVAPFFEHWQWKGPAEVEIKCDNLTGENKVIEINSRFPSYLRFAHHCGLDIATMAVRLALKEDVRPLDYPAYRVGVTYMNPGLLIKSAAWHSRRTGVAELPQILSEFGEGFACTLDMLRDPLPFLGRAIADLRQNSGSTGVDG